MCVAIIMADTVDAAADTLRTDGMQRILVIVCNVKWGDPLESVQGFWHFNAGMITLY